MTEDGNEDERPSERSAWRWAELIFGSSVVVYLIGATVSGIWWAASLSEKTQNVDNRLSAIERRFDGLDNVSLGNRMTKVEVELQNLREQSIDQQARMERKIDRLLEQRYGTHSGPNQSGSPE